ncbi:o-succinylbenzoate synthase [Sporosarcina ureilytica]|uniref:o-succinylbenzoate synthase n=1 Tax=Sporosarcina ureilytica TaxID=298596 RepID=A0A1D8JEA2_9BACL|nr:o-succinylbenzoate synthase [Sporosarcina ureilytica]AOV07029.1 o-succinylbenzoate synthase [Sporosarcina ureilytica]
MVVSTIKEIRLHRLSIPLKNPFSTHLQTVQERESIVLEMVDETGAIGLGECVAFSSPWYTEETVQTCWDALENWLVPSILNQQMTHPSTLLNRMKHVKGNRMAKAAIDLAAWDLFSKRKEVPLWQGIDGVRQEIDAGVVLTGAIDESMYEQIERAMQTGYKRVKLKIDKATEPEALEKLIRFYPSVSFFGDANGLFSKLGLQALQSFDLVGLTLIEQPFGEDEWALHHQANRRMKTPIALDESIRSVTDVERMIEIEAGKIIVLKPGRVGGISEAIQIHDLAVQHRIPVWIGGMIELGISKAHNLALASLSQMTLPGDFSASNHFWHEDIVSPTIDVNNGTITLSEKPGIGYDIDAENIEKFRIDYRIFT